MPCSRCQQPLRFRGIATTEANGASFGWMVCSNEHMAWRLGRTNWRESQWRLTLPISRFASVLSRFLPLAGADIAGSDMYRQFAELPPPSEYRPGQQGLGFSISLALRDQSILLANAGVGIGKTFAYLLPMLSWLANHRSDTIVISTRTILLQHQLLGDIADAQKILGTSVPILLVKGQGQYLCMKKLEGVPLDNLTAELATWRTTWLSMHRSAVRKEEVKLKNAKRRVYHGQSNVTGGYVTERIYTDAQAEEIADKRVAGPDFDIDQIDRVVFPGVQDAVWDQLQVDAQTDCKSCNWSKACGWAKLHGARSEFRGLLIVNHGLLVRDAYNRLHQNLGLWPLPRAVVIDEAHAVEDSLRTASARPIPSTTAIRALHNAVDRLTSSPLEGSRTIAREANLIIAGLDRSLHESLECSARQAHDADGEFEVKVRALVACDTLQSNIQGLLDLQSRLEDALLLAGADRTNALLEPIFETLTQLAAWLDQGDRSPYVVWVDNNTIYVGDLDLSAVMAVLSQRTTILTSGTLAIEDQFGLLENALGLVNAPEKRTRILRFYAPSPFDYPHQLRYQLVTNLTDPRDNTRFEHRASEIAIAVEQLHAQHRRVLVLFTSTRLLRAVESWLPGNHVIRDGNASAPELSDQFRSRDRVIYLSTAAWEGLDASGPKAVVIVQLPYPVPSDPWLRAKARIAELNSQQVMQQLIEPMMQIRMIQGVGRTIRRHGDQGTVVILDPRGTERFSRVLQPILPLAPFETITLAQTNNRDGES